MRLRPRIAPALALLFVLLLAVPSLASATSSKEQAVYKDCTDGQIDGHYSQQVLADALAHLPADVDEYTDCRSQIQRAQLGGASGSGGGGSSSGGGGTAGAGATSGGGGTSGGTGGGDTGTAAPAGADPLASATDAEKAAFQKAVAAGGTPVQLDGRPIHPGELGGAKSSDLPAPLIGVLALLILAGLGAAGLGTRRLVLGRRTA